MPSSISHETYHAIHANHDEHINLPQYIHDTHDKYENLPHYLCQAWYTWKPTKLSMQTMISMNICRIIHAKHDKHENLPQYLCQAR